jgi:hypothetical protein
MFQLLRSNFGSDLVQRLRIHFFESIPHHLFEFFRGRPGDFVLNRQAFDFIRKRQRVNQDDGERFS